MIVSRSIALALLLAPAVALAEEPKERGDPATPGERTALAETLFDKGKALMADARYAEACAMLAESQRLDPAGGTLITLALCHEREGKTATAWTEFKDAQARSAKEGDADREAVANAHATALEAKLSRLTVRVPSGVAAAPGLAITRDGVALAKPAWDLPVPVDPGDHRVEASAPGMRSWSHDVHVTADGGAIAIDVPALEALPDQPAPILPPPPSRWTPRVVGGVALVAAGAVAAGVGAFYGVRAISKQADANARCPTDLCSDDGALASSEAARSSAIVADLAIPVGLAAGAVGVILLVTSPSAPARATSSGWIVRVGAPSLVVGHTF